MLQQVLALISIPRSPCHGIDLDIHPSHSLQRSLSFKIMTPAGSSCSGFEFNVCKRFAPYACQAAPTSIQLVLPDMHTVIVAVALNGLSTSQSLVPSPQLCSMSL